MGKVDDQPLIQLVQLIATFRVISIIKTISIRHYFVHNISDLNATIKMELQLK